MFQRNGVVLTDDFLWGANNTIVIAAKRVKWTEREPPKIETHLLNVNTKSKYVAVTRGDIDLGRRSPGTPVTLQCVHVYTIAKYD